MPKKIVNTDKATKIVFFGSPEFAIPAFMALTHENTSILAITAPARPIGRSQTISETPIRKMADSIKVPVIEAESMINAELLAKISDFQADLFIIVAFGKLLPQSLLEIPKYGALNIHPSLLPKYRGPSPIENAILTGDSVTGVSIMQIDALMDHGPILSQEKLTIRKTDNRLGLSKSLAELGASLLIKTYPRWIAGRIIAKPQLDEIATFTKLLSREDGRIFWNKPAVVLERQVRAFYGWPESFFFWRRNNQMLRCKIDEAHVVEGPMDESAYGRVWQSAEAAISVETADGWLAIDRLCLEGKSTVSAADFVNGYPDIVGTLLL